ncbi:MAG: preprotein translocase subunit SecE [Clostridia bacterium]|nr:preprotein translocase subunit SecE [Clostridia bacterium]MDD4685773.1 preprotein translocase subunit SecE [Clostridia bacterium]
MPSKNTKKKLAKNKKSNSKGKLETEQITEVKELNSSEISVAEVPVLADLDEKAETNEMQLPAKQEKKQETKTDTKSGKAKDKNVKKDKKPSKFKRKTKEVFSELKKVIWPTFSQVAKKTGTVIAFVLIFAVILLGIDTVLDFAYSWFFGLFE